MAAHSQKLASKTRVCRLLVYMNARNISKEFLVESLDMLINEQR